MSDIQKDLQNMLDELVDAGEERGAQVAAYLNGELIVDAWSGVANASTGQPVDGDTLFPVFSTKTNFLIHKQILILNCTRASC